jgi:hypothetical protein
MDMAFELDPVKYGVLWNTVENNEKKLEEMNRKMDKMEVQLDQLVAQSNKQAGIAWLGIAMLTVLSTIGGWALKWFTDK